MSLRPGLFAINRSGASGTTEVHTLIGQENFSNFSIHESTGLHPTGSEWSFKICDLDDDLFPDLAAINRNGASGTTEIHVLSGESKFKKFILQTPTGLSTTGAEWDFAFADWNGDGHIDLIAINRHGPSTKTEVHVLSGASGWKEFIAHISTGLDQTDLNWSFLIADWNNSGHSDLVAINRQGASGSTEIHVLSGESNLQKFILHTATGLHTTGIEWRFGVADWDNDGSLDLVAINPNGTSNTTEIHILSAASNFGVFVVHAATGLHHTNSSWELLVAEEFIHLQIDDIASKPSVEPARRPFNSLDFTLVAATSSGSIAKYFPMNLNSKERQFVKEHPISAGRAYLSARDSLSRAAREFPDSVLNGKGDAVRHCNWSAQLHRDLDSSIADEILVNHEFGKNDKYDNHNNSIGKGIGSKADGVDNDGLWGQCKEAANNGELEFDTGDD
jgi:FG-GAP-like repeat